MAILVGFYKRKEGVQVCLTRRARSGDLYKNYIKIVKRGRKGVFSLLTFTLDYRIMLLGVGIVTHIRPLEEIWTSVYL